MKYVLFVCTHNAGRSQMAQAFFERDCSHDCRAESAGSQPARQVWPDSHRGDARGRDRPRRPQAQAAHRRDATARRLGGDDGLRRRLPLRPDPRRRLGHPRPGRQAARPRCARSGTVIQERVRDLVENRIDEIESDPTSHQWRLAKLLPS